MAWKQQQKYANVGKWIWQPATSPKPMIGPAITVAAANAAVVGNNVMEKPAWSCAYCQSLNPSQKTKCGQCGLRRTFKQVVNAQQQQQGPVSAPVPPPAPPAQVMSPVRTLLQEAASALAAATPPVASTVGSVGTKDKENIDVKAVKARMASLEEALRVLPDIPQLVDQRNALMA